MGTDTYDEYEKTEIALVDLKAQTHQISQIKNVQSIAVGAEGKLNAYVENEGMAAFWQYDVSTDVLEKQLAVFEGDMTPGGMASYKEKVGLP